jgi:hypothetical protein
MPWLLVLGLGASLIGGGALAEAGRRSLLVATVASGVPGYPFARRADRGSVSRYIFSTLGRRCGRHSHSGRHWVLGCGLRTPAPTPAEAWSCVPGDGTAGRPR